MEFETAAAMRGEMPIMSTLTDAGGWLCAAGDNLPPGPRQRQRNRLRMALDKLGHSSGGQKRKA
jgi:hypothetical protein